MEVESTPQQDLFAFLEADLQNIIVFKKHYIQWHIYHFAFVACSRFRPLGMKDGKIKESQLSSSSYMKTELNKIGNCPHFSRPGSVGVFTVEDGMLHYDRNNFLQVDFRSKTKVEMVMKPKSLHFVYQT